MALMQVPVSMLAAEHFRLTDCTCNQRQRRFPHVVRACSSQVSQRFHGKPSIAADRTWPSSRHAHLPASRRSCATPPPPSSLPSTKSLVPSSLVHPVLLIPGPLPHLSAWTPPRHPCISEVVPLAPLAASLADPLMRTDGASRMSQGVT